MINLIQVLLCDEKYILKEYDRKIVLFKGNSNVYPEEYIEIEKEILIDKFIISEVHRDVRQIKIETEKKEEASLCAVVIYKRLYDDIVNRMRARSIRNYLKLGEKEKALACGIECCDNSVYSIDYEDSLRISLIQSKDKVDVKFGGEYLAQSAALSRGYVVFYNYCEKLKHISLFCAEIQKRLEFDINREKILRLYILGR